MSTESSEHIEEAAGEWVARRELGAWSPQDQQAFDAWFNTSMLHRVAYWRLESAWETTSRLKALGAGSSSDRPPPPGQWNLSPFFTPHTETDPVSRASDDGPNRRHFSGSGGLFSKYRLRALAASLMLASAVAASWWLWPASDRYQTPVGATASLPIADGSKVILNTDSAIKITLNDKERRIELEAGEAFFDVVKDPTRPFVVVAGNKRVVAVGTKFSVRRDPGKRSDDIQVVVTEGAVNVESADDGRVERLSQRPLTAGMVARANRAGLMLQRKRLSEAEEQLAWRDGVLVLRRVTLAEAAAEFNRYNKQKIMIEDAIAAGLTIEGTFRTTQVEAFVRLLERGFPVTTEIDGEKIVVRAE